MKEANDTGPRFPDLQLEDLERRSSEHDQKRYFWEDYAILFKGGSDLVTAAGQTVISRTYAGNSPTNFVSAIMSDLGFGQQRRFLWKAPNEQWKKYLQRWERLNPLSYVTLFINHLVGKVCEEAPRLTGKDQTDLPDGFDEWVDAPNSNRKSLNDIGMQLLQDLCVYGKAGWMLFDRGADDAAEETGLGSMPCVEAFAGPEILYEQRDDDGCLEYVVVKKERTVRDFPDAPYILRTYTYLDRDYWQEWQVAIDRKTTTSISGKKRKQTTTEAQDGDLEITGFGDHGLGQVPFVLVDLPVGMWIMDMLGQWQVEVINFESQLSYNKTLHSNTQLLFTSPKSGDAATFNKVLGAGSIVPLAGGASGAGEDVSEKLEELKRDSSPMQFLADDQKRLISDGFRIVSMIAVDPDTVGTLARSGESKKEDRKNNDTQLVRYGSVLRNAVQQLVDLALIFQSKGEEPKVSIDVQGYDTFSAEDLADIWANVTTVKELNLGSPTLISEASIAPALRMLGDDVTEDVKKKVTDELRAAKGGDPIVKPVQTTDTTTVSEDETAPKSAAPPKKTKASGAK